MEKQKGGSGAKRKNCAEVPFGCQVHRAETRGRDGEERAARSPRACRH